MVRIILFFCFALVVSYEWATGHLPSIATTWWRSGLLLLVFTLFFSGFFAWYSQKKEALDSNAPVRFLLLFIIAIFLPLLIFETSNLLSATSSTKAITVTISPLLFLMVSGGVFLQKVVILFGVLILTTAVFFVTGNRLFGILGVKRFSTPDILFACLVRIALGISLWSLIAFGLGLFKILTLPFILGIASVFLLLEYSILLKLFSRFSLLTKDICFSLRQFGTKFLIILISFILIVFLIENMKPTPTGFDDMTQYMNRAHLIMEQNALVPGGNPFPFELLTATLGIATGSSSLDIAMSLNVLFVAFACLGLFGLGRFLFNPATGLIATALWISLPMTVSLATQAVKPDILLLFITTIILWSFFLWLSKQHTPYLLLSAFFFGFALTIKLTAFFLVAPLLIGFFLAWRKQRFSFSRSLRLIMLVLCFSLLPLLSWIGYGLMTRGGVPPSFNSAFLSSKSPNTILDSSALALLDIDPHQDCRSTGTEEDFAAYEKDNASSLTNILFLPWDLSMNNRVGSSSTDFGFLFLVFLPAFLFWPKILKTEPLTGTSVSKSTALFLFSLGYFLLWGYFSRYIPWYGFPGLLILALLVASVINNLKLKHRLERILFALFLFGVITSTFIHLRSFPDDTHFLYASGILNEKGFNTTFFSSYYPTVTLLNEHPEHRILMTGSTILYFIEDNDTRILSDQFLDNFSCLNNEADHDLTLKRLRQLDIHYVFFSKKLFDIAQSLEQGILKEKIAAFGSFSQEKLTIITDTPTHTLFSVPY